VAHPPEVHEEGTSAFPGDVPSNSLPYRNQVGCLCRPKGGDSEIGSTTGGAMATSEEADPAPSVEVSEGADIPTKERRSCG